MTDRRWRPHLVEPLHAVCGKIIRQEVEAESAKEWPSPDVGDRRAEPGVELADSGVLEKSVVITMAAAGAIKRRKTA